MSVAFTLESASASCELSGLLLVQSRLRLRARPLVVIHLQLFLRLRLLLLGLQLQLLAGSRLSVPLANAGGCAGWPQAEPFAGRVAGVLLDCKQAALVHLGGRTGSKEERTWRIKRLGWDYIIERDIPSCLR